MSRSTLFRHGKQILSRASCFGALLISFSAMTPETSTAAIYKCVSSSGSVSYSGRKCPEEETTARIIADSGIGNYRKGAEPKKAAASPEPDSESAERVKRRIDKELGLRKAPGLPSP